MSVKEEQEEVNFLNLPDEDFDKFGSIPPTSQNPEKDNEEDGEDTSELQAQEQEVETEDQTESKESDDDINESEDSDTETLTESKIDDLDNEDDGNEEEDSVETKTPKEQSEEEKVNAFYKLITTPIKANGKEIVIKSPEEALKLIQMGAGYNAKMHALKPARQVLKTLEQNNMLDGDKIGFAIDLVSGNKDAILKLLKDNNINPLELDTEDNNGYKSNTRIASVQSVEFDDVLDNIRTSEHYDATLNTVKTWDKRSQSEVAKNPQLIEHLNAQIGNGTYSTVANELERRRALGDNSLSNLSDLEAYVTVGRLLAQDGVLTPPKAQGEVSNTQIGRKVLPQEGSRKNPETQSKKKKAAGVPRGKPEVKSASNEINPLALDDEEFDKLMAKFT
jgi:hypothetical protein